MNRKYDVLIHMDEVATKILVHKSIEYCFVHEQNEPSKLPDDPHQITFVYNHNGFVDIVWEPMLISVGLQNDSPQNNSYFRGIYGLDSPNQEDRIKFLNDFTRYAKNKNWKMLIIYPEGFDPQVEEIVPIKH